MSLRQLARTILAKQTRASLINRFVSWEYWYKQGLQVVASFKLTSVVEILAVIAFVKYMMSGLSSLQITQYIIAGILCGLAWICLRTWFYWTIGRFWHNNNGYGIQTKWNIGKVPPGRAEVVNAELIALLIAKYSKLSIGELDELIEQHKKEN